MTARMHWGIIVLSFLAGLSGCGSDDSSNNQPTTAPTVSGPVGGTITPIPPASPPPPASAAAVPSSPPNTGDGRPTGLSAPTATPAAFVSATRFAEQMPAEQSVGPTYSPEGGEYDLGSALVSTADTSPTVFLARIHGWIRYPGRPVTSSSASPASYPVIVFLHGQHNPAAPNFEGYDYLASDLAAHGYVTLSIDANDINAFSPTSAGSTRGDYSSQSRGQLVLATLDRLRRLNDGNQTTSGIQLPPALIGRIDFNRIGIMGHSRGGQGINDAIRLNQQRVGVTLQQLRSATAELQNETNWARNVWYAAPGATVTTGSRATFLATLSALITALNNSASDNDLSTILDMNNIMLSAGPGTGPNAPPAYTFRAAFSLAPTDGQNYQRIANVPFAAMVGSCDGDVTNLSGTHVFDNNRFSQEKGDTAPRFQIVVRGANHNFFNTQWTSDDYRTTFDLTTFSLPLGSQTDYCALSSPATSAVRLASADQRAVGQFLINSFMRDFVGGETVFNTYWNGTASLPAAACPGGQSPCDNRVMLTIQANGANTHRLVAPFDDHYGLNQLYDSSTSRLHVGDPLDLIDSSTFAGNIYTCLTNFTLGDGHVPSCSPTPPANVFFKTSPTLNVPLTTYGGGLLSIANQVQFTLTGPNQTLPITLRQVDYGTGGPTITADSLSTAGFDTLTFRIALVRPVVAAAGPLVAQQVDVTLTDSSGVSSPTIHVTDFSDALDSSMGLPIPANSSMPELLNMVAIPLDAFRPNPASGSTFDPTHLSRLTLNFPNTPNDRTGVALTDIELQNLGRATH